MARLNPRTLKQQASVAMRKRKYAKALNAYLALEKLEPREGEWPRRAADMHRRLHRLDDALGALGRSADAYAKAGFVIKAVAVCKLVLHMDPENELAKQRLSRLNAERGMPTPRKKRSPKRSPKRMAVGTDPTLTSAPNFLPPEPPQEDSVELMAKLLATPAPSATIDQTIVPEPSSQLTPEPAHSIARGGEFEIRDTARTRPTYVKSGEFEIRDAARNRPSDVKSGEFEVRDAVGDRNQTRQQVHHSTERPVVVEDLASRVTEPPVVSDRKLMDARTLYEMKMDSRPRRKRRTLPPGQPLDAVELRNVIPGAKQKLRNGTDSGVFEIPLDLNDVEIVESFDIERPLRLTPLFSALSPTMLQWLIDKVEIVELPPGEILFREGDNGSRLYVIAEGSVDVLTEGPPPRILRQLHEGDIFGEVAIVTEQPRSATIEGSGDRPALLLAIDRPVLSDLIEAEESILTVLLRILRDRLLDRLLRTNPMFAPFSARERQSLSGRFLFLEVQAGADLVEQGQAADGLYILLSGQAEVLLGREQAGEELLSVVGPGDICGEMSLLTQEPAMATIRTICKSFILMLPTKVFRQLIMTHPQVLTVVAELAEKRKKRLEAVVEGTLTYQTDRICLV